MDTQLLEQMGIELFPVWPLYLTAFAAALMTGLGAWWYRRSHQRWGTPLSFSGLTGELVARRLLAECGIENVRVVQQGVKDLYHPWKKEIRLSPANYTSSTLSALTTAAHEVGHAQQFAERTRLARIHQICWPICCGLLAVAIVLPVASVLLSITPVSLENAGAVAVSLAVTMLLLQLPVILPLERDASRRARILVTQAKLLSASEQQGFDVLLKSAWLTYAATEACRWMMIVAAGTMLCSMASIWEQPKSVTDVSIADHESRKQPSSTSMPQVDVLTQPVRPLSLFEAIWPNLMGLLLMVPIIFAMILLGRLIHPRKTVADRAIMFNNSGLLCYERGDFVAAIAAFDTALQIDPHMAAARYNRGQAKLALDDLEGAAADFHAALEIAPRLIGAKTGLGDVALRCGDVAGAESAYDEALALAPQHAAVLTSRGYVRWMQNNFDGAAADFNLALKYSPQDTSALAGQGFVAMSRNQLAEALAIFERAAALGSRDAIEFAAQARSRLADEGVRHDQFAVAEVLN